MGHLNEGQQVKYVFLSVGCAGRAEENQEISQA
jgi:hypothetical protein